MSARSRALVELKQILAMMKAGIPWSVMKIAAILRSIQMTKGTQKPRCSNRFRRWPSPVSFPCTHMESFYASNALHASIPLKEEKIINKIMLKFSWTRQQLFSFKWFYLPVEKEKIEMLTFFVCSFRFFFSVKYSWIKATKWFMIFIKI